MIGILLLNLGTPEAPTTSAVRRYLREFLSDERVIDIPAIPRWMLVNLIIAPFRSPKSAKSYQKIWTPQGSPLLLHTRAMGEALQKILGPEYRVKTAMRYGRPSIQQALSEFQREGVEEVRALPLYPQYASSSTGSTVQKLQELQKRLSPLPPLKILPPFFDHPGFIQSFVETATPILQASPPDHILFSFHGLPERHLIKEDISGKHCLKSDDCCDRIIPANGLCYRAHCFQTARRIAAALKLDAKDYTICFQSRLGRTPWIQPFTDHLLESLPKQGKKRVAVFCPSFVADCLETLEEIGVRGQRQFRENGGQELIPIPCPNEHPTWIRALAAMTTGSDF